MIEQFPALQKLSVEEKWLLANELWSEVEERQEELPVSEEIVALVERRFAEYEKDPSTALTLEEFKQRYRLP
jgi:putative addiction module component (TIGR02574 family)